MWQYLLFVATLLLLSTPCEAGGVIIGPFCVDGAVMQAGTNDLTLAADGRWTHVHFRKAPGTPGKPPMLAVFKTVPAPSSYVLLPLGDFLLSAAAVNEPGFPQHLVGVDILLARRLAEDVDKVNQAAIILASRTGDNPFFKYLSEGATPIVVSSVLSTCPAPDRPSANRFQWTWERVAKTNSWMESMYGECIFLGNLLRGSP
jgi:hypothetical protein